MQVRRTIFSSVLKRSKGMPCGEALQVQKTPERIERRIEQHRLRSQREKTFKGKVVGDGRAYAHRS